MRAFAGWRAPAGAPGRHSCGRSALHAGTQLQGRYTRCRQCRRRVLLPPVRAEPGRALEQAWAEAADEAGDGEAGSTECSHGFDGGSTGLKQHTGPEAGVDAGADIAGFDALPAVASQAQPEPVSRAEVSDRISKVVNLVRTAHILSPYDKQEFNAALLLWCVHDDWCCSCSNVNPQGSEGIEQCRKTIASIPAADRPLLLRTLLPTCACTSLLPAS